LAVFASFSFVTNDARAETPCGDAGVPVVQIAFDGAAWSAALEQGVVEQLRAGLRPTGLDVCAGPGEPAATPVATIELRQDRGERVVVTIEVRDGVTRKRVARDVDLSALPEDGYALGLGVAADELLRASWAELALRDASVQEMDRPKAVERTLERSLKPPAKTNEAGAAFAYDGFTFLFLYGADVTLRHWFVPHFAVELDVGARGAGDAYTVNGTISTTALDAAISFGIGRTPLGPFQVDVEASVFAAELRFRGSPLPGARGADQSALAIAARWGSRVSLPITPTFLVSLRAGFGTTLRGVSATDRGDTVTGASGFNFFGSLGPTVAF
jgi:hypothetical protein